MKFEKINDKQIRCTLNNSDLGDRGINLLELAYGSEKARELFREMLQKASAELGFETDNSPLMVEATPLSNESLLVIITKVDDPEELDTRFSKFSPALEDELSSLIKHIENITSLEGAADLKPQESTEDSKAAEGVVRNYSRVFTFHDLDTMIAASRHIGSDYAGQSCLYKNPADSLYYLLLDNHKVESSAFISTCNILAEYGKKIAFFHSSKAHFEEHFELIIKEQAINKLAGI